MAGQCECQRHSGYEHCRRDQRHIYTEQSPIERLRKVLQLARVKFDCAECDQNVGGWTASSGNGNNATYSGATTPTLASLATPNGTPAVNVTSGSGSFLLASSLDPSIGHTVFP